MKLIFQSNSHLKFKLSRFLAVILRRRLTGAGGKCWDRRQTVNLVSAGGIVEQSVAAKNNAVDQLAVSTGWLAGWLAADASGGSLADCLLADWLAGCWLAAAAAGRLGDWLAVLRPQNLLMHNIQNQI